MLVFKLFNLVIWIATITLFWVVSSRLLQSHHWATFATLIYTLSPQASNYASYPRMYGIILFLVLGYIFLETKLDKSFEDRKTIIIQAVILLLLSALHPALIAFFILVGVYTVVRRIGFALFAGLSSVLLASLILIGQLLDKHAPLETYAQGLEYTSLLSKSLSESTYEFFFSIAGNFEELVFGIVLLALFNIARHRKIRATGSTLFVYLALGEFMLFIALSSFELSRFVPHHYIYLAPFVAIGITAGIKFASFRTQAIILPLLIYVFLTGYISFSSFQNIYLSSLKRFCTEISSISSGIILTDKQRINYVIHCTDYPNTYYLDRSLKPIHFDSSSHDLDLLISQAREGGRIDITSEFGFWEKNKDEIITQSTTPIFIPPAGFATSTAYYIPHKPPSANLYDSEHMYFSNYTLTSRIYPLLFQFTPKPLINADEQI